MELLRLHILLIGNYCLCCPEIGRGEINAATTIAIVNYYANMPGKVKPEFESCRSDSNKREFTFPQSATTIALNLMEGIRTTVHGHPGAGSLTLAVLCVLGVNLSSATDWFVRCDGDDSASGVNRKAAWRSIERVNRARLQPGDRVLFQAGQTFTGNLLLTAEDAGTASAPVVVGALGDGPAILFAGGRTGITVENAGGITIENLVVVGAGITNNSGFGILCDNTLTNATMLEHLSIKNVEVRGFGKHGILVTGAPAGFRHVRVSRCLMHDNLLGGMEIAGRLPWDSPHYAHADVQVTQCRAFDNPGDPNYHKNHSGSGMVLYEVDGGLMDRCMAWNNGALNGSGGGGPVGIWTCASRRVAIQHCESFGNRTQGADGGGFDIDGGSEDCVLQYNYSHDNDGPGLMVYTYAYASHTDRGNVVRFNISQNDSRKSRSYAGLWVRNDGNGMTDLEVYNNTVIVGTWTDQAAGIHGEGVEANFRNNVFLAAGDAVPLRVEKPHGRLRFENNLYWREGNPVTVAWNQEAYASLAAWRKAAGQELLDGRPVGLFENPKLSLHAPGVCPSPSAGVRKLEAFRPLRGSPAKKAGLNLQRRLGSGFASEDISGNRLPTTGSWPLGALAR